MPYYYVLALLGLKLSCCFYSEKFVHNGGGWPYRNLKYGSTQGIILLYMLLISTKLQLDTWYFISIVAHQAVKKLSLSHGQHCSYIFSGVSLACASELVVLCNISDNISNVPSHGQVIKNLLLLTHPRAKTYKKQLQTQKHLRWSKKKNILLLSNLIWWELRCLCAPMLHFGTLNGGFGPKHHWILLGPRGWARWHTDLV